MASKFINPYTDFGFKKLFGEEANKDLLIDFLNTLLPPKHQIATLEFRNADQLGDSYVDRRAIYDIYCENEKKEPFIVEMQKAEQEFFKDRSVYYVTHPIRKQGQKGLWNYQQLTVYFIGILDFQYDKDNPEPDLICKASLKDQHGREFYEKLQLIYIQMPLFTKTETELETHRDKWLYFLKNLPSLEQIPVIFNEEVFKKAFQTAEIAAMPEMEREIYQFELDGYRTYLATIETAEKKGKAKGREEGIAIGEAKRQADKIETARNLKHLGVDCETIAKATGLSRNEIERLN
ncbi:MAG: Rpn family recombination-promoting nuclease/putative transposase [Planctomycetaceae bacterium]|jgi:predicted transposase/invertase (TIGR01784 family)|nr:Rpn family recombination-promoting nuclease/putative transposase [Planctomycetaceae bacterium]